MLDSGTATLKSCRRRIDIHAKNPPMSQIIEVTNHLLVIKPASDAAFERSGMLCNADILSVNCAQVSQTMSASQLKYRIQRGSLSKLMRSRSRPFHVSPAL